MQAGLRQQAAAGREWMAAVAVAAAAAAAAAAASVRE